MTYNDVLTATYRHDFPMMRAQNREKPLIFLDSAASAQKPQVVIDAMNQFYEKQYANIHRGIYAISEAASMLYETARDTVKEFIHAKNAHEIVFVRGTTEGINFIAHTLSLGSDKRKPWRENDEVIITEMEHHANIVPWQFLAKRLGINIRIVPVNDTGELDISVYKALFSEKTKLVAVTHVSNVLGTINPIKEMAAIAHQHGVPILVDGAQAAPHIVVDVFDLDCDFYTFSAHKLYGPTGIGALYINERYLHDLPPYQGGGNMIRTVSFDEVTFREPPHCFETGTPAITEAIGFMRAIQYVNAIGMEHIRQHDLALLDYAESQLNKEQGLVIYGRSEEKAGVISFTMDGVHPHDIGTILDSEGIAVRAGHHCAMPLMTRFQVPAMVRIGFGIYSNTDDIDALMRAFQLIRRMFQ
jgi:cysteine desulfurase/selenocysteine lyase